MRKVERKETIAYNIIAGEGIFPEIVDEWLCREAFAYDNEERKKMGHKGTLPDGCAVSDVGCGGG